jgi:GTPase-associated protein 1, N-terminal domain type 1
VILVGASADTFEIEQALFGYRDGHHLLAGSVNFPPGVRQFLATVTDGSGPESTEGFEKSYTGLPIPRTSYYALFCTWPAPEMPRPGCVWSHVLLIDFKTLGIIPELTPLRRLYMRPTSITDFQAYEESLALPDIDKLGGLTVGNQIARAAHLVNALYAQPTKSIVILAEANREWQKTVFAVWSQQWPSLRARFSFSTGSWGDRRLAGVPFDLQIAPSRSRRLWGRAESPTAVLDYVDGPSLTARIAWVDVALDDLSRRGTHTLRRFLRTYAIDVEPSRRSFARIASFFAAIQGRRPASPLEQLAHLGELFPSASDAGSLKREWLCKLVENADSDNRDGNWAAIYFLVKANKPEAFENVGFNFNEHIQDVWQRKRADLLALIRDVPDGARTNELLDALADILTPHHIAGLWSEQSMALRRIVSRRPALLAHPAAWVVSHDAQLALWETIRAVTDDPQMWGEICGAMLAAGATLREKETAGLAGPWLKQGLLKWMRSDTFRLPSHAWREALQQPLREVLAEPSVPSALLGLIAWILPNAETREIAGDREDVQLLAKDVNGTLPQALVIPTLFWLVTIGLKTKGEAGFLILSKAFFPVYDSVARSNYLGEAWDILAPVLPEALFGFDWDRCNRLRRGLSAWMHDNPDFASAMRNAGHAPNDVPIPVRT